MSISSDPTPGDFASAEVAPGVRVQRRSFLGLCSAAILSPHTLSRGLPGCEEEPRLTLDEFLEEVVPTARELKQKLGAKPGRSAEDRYLLTLASHAVRLGDVPAPELRPTPQGEQVEIGVSSIADPFVVLHWRMQPGAVIRLHAHTYGNVCTLGLEGRARVRNYETVEAFDPGVEQPLLVRRTNDQLLDPFGTNLVPLSHGFCHGFEAGPEGARGLDITTRLAERQPTPYLELESSPVDAAAGLHRGRWRFDP